MDVTIRPAIRRHCRCHCPAIVKDSYWRWPERNLAGNAIDFHVQVLGLTFHAAVHQFTGT
jgi:hypothetical protein